MNEPMVSPTKPNHSLAIVSLVLGILGLAVIVPVLGPIGAVITGNIARREIQQNPQQYSGESLAKAGVILGWVGIGLTVIVGLLAILALLFFVPLAVQRGQ